MNDDSRLIAPDPVIMEAVTEAMRTIRGAYEHKDRETVEACRCLIDLFTSPVSVFRISHQWDMEAVELEKDDP